MQRQLKLCKFSKLCKLSKLSKLALPVPYHPYSGDSCLACGDGGTERKRTRRWRRCSGCGTASYCGRGCQKEDWKRVHRRECKLIQVVVLHAQNGRTASIWELLVYGTFPG